MANLNQTEEDYRPTLFTPNLVHENHLAASSRKLDSAGSIRSPIRHQRSNKFTTETNAHVSSARGKNSFSDMHTSEAVA